MLCHLAAQRIGVDRDLALAANRRRLPAWTRLGSCSSVGCYHHGRCMDARKYPAEAGIRCERFAANDERTDSLVRDKLFGASGLRKVAAAEPLVFTARRRSERGLQAVDGAPYPPPPPPEQVGINHPGGHRCLRALSVAPR